MKKITKKAIKEAPAYIITIDYTVDTKKGLERKTLAATNLVEAMAEAETFFSEEVYLIDLAEKTGDIDADVNGLIYKDILTSRRRRNWHITDKQHSESPASTAYNLEFGFFQIVSIEY